MHKRGLQLILKVIGVVIALSVVTGLVNWLNEDASPEKVVRIGDEDLNIPSDTAENIFATTRAALDQLGYEPWYQNCIISQAERLMSPAEVIEFETVTPWERKEIGAKLILKAQPHCLESERPAISPDATSRQLALIRAETAKSVKSIVPNLPPSFLRCAADQIRSASDIETLELANSTTAEIEALYAELFRPCT